MLEVRRAGPSTGQQPVLQAWAASEASREELEEHRPSVALAASPEVLEEHQASVAWGAYLVELEAPLAWAAWAAHQAEQVEPHRVAWVA